MSSEHVNYLLIGSGLAGSSAAEAIRRHDPAGTVLLVGQEVSRPYHRPPLSRAYLRREVSRTELITLPVEWYAEHAVELRTGRRLSSIDAVRRFATLDNADEIAFDTMLLAVGAQPRALGVPGHELPNIFTLRTVEDADRIAQAVDQSRAEGRTWHDMDGAQGRGRVAIVGAGPLALDLASTFVDLNLHVDLIVGHPYPLAKFAGSTTGQFIARQLDQHRVHAHVDVRVARFEGDGRVQRVALTDGGTLHVDLVVVAIGVHFNRGILRNTPIAAEKAILVDEYLRTNVPGIFAAGDCAAVYDAAFGKHLVMDHWDNARHCGALAGINMCAHVGRTAREPYRHVAYFETDLFGTPMQVWGAARFVDRRIIRGNPTPEGSGFVEFGIAADGRVAQVIQVGSLEKPSHLRAIVKSRLNTAGIEEALREASIPLPVVPETE
jgi:3-phenylpropionate/trans-cinnamate dioxygenase ferredoxin reductase subunit